jgi:hypothetical protein
VRRLLVRVDGRTLVQFRGRSHGFLHCSSG